MVFLQNAVKKYGWTILLTLLLTAVQLVRVAAFAGVYGGIEHDSGWFLSVSRSLAEHGTYTTMVSTLVDPHPVSGIDIDQKFNIQDPDGRIWFFTGNGNGPVSIIANAAVLKVFGSGFWALRAGPLIFYALFLLLAAYILFRLVGLWAVLLFNAFIFFYPHISIFLGYEAMGEVPSMVFILWSYLAFAWAAKKSRRRWLYFFVAGLVIGLTINTKLITLWAVSGVFIWAGIVWLAGWARRASSKVAGSKVAGSNPVSPIAYRLSPITLPELLILGSGIPLTLALWELAHLIILTRLAGFEMYQQHLQQRIKFILDDGSGVGLQIHSGPEFFWDKFFLLTEISHPQRWVVALLYMAIVLGSLYLLWRWRSLPVKHNVLMPMALGWLAHTAWFVILAKTGWPRHLWFALVLAAMLLSAISVELVQRGLHREASEVNRKSKIQNPKSLAVGILLLLLITWGFINQPHVWGLFLPDDIVPYWQQKQISNKYHAGLPWIIIPRQAQTEVIDYIRHMPPEAKIYYPGQHKSAEITPQTGRLHYPLNRRNYVEAHPADIALIGPSMVSSWKDPVQRRDLLELVAQECPQPALRNDFYIICPIEANLPQQ